LIVKAFKRSVKIRIPLYQGIFFGLRQAEIKKIALIGRWLGPQTTRTLNTYDEEDFTLTYAPVLADWSLGY
jgi:hypothetical protein